MHIPTVGYYRGALSYERGTPVLLTWLQRLSPEKWLKPRPESGLDCLNCAELADLARGYLSIYLYIYLSIYLYLSIYMDLARGSPRTREAAWPSRTS